MELDIQEESRDGHARVAVSGALDLGSAPALCLRLTNLRRAGARVIVLDLSALEFCDSTGLRALIGEVREAEITGTRLVVVPPDGGSAHRLFELTGARQMLPFATALA